MNRYSSVLREEVTLFWTGDWFQEKQRRNNKLIQEIANEDSEGLLNMSTHDLAKYYADKYNFDYPELGEPAISNQEMNIDVSSGRDPFPEDFRSGIGPVIIVEIPFTGEAAAFGFKASSFSFCHPKAKVTNDTLSFIVRMEGTTESINSEIKNRIDSIKEHLSWLVSDINQYNGELLEFATNEIERRKRMLLKANSIVASLGYPVKIRPGQKLTYPAPLERQIIRNKAPKPTTSTAQFEPEPELETSDYESILSILENMVKVMELSPSTFKGISEEDLRNHFLVQLNGQFQGDATGETFNHEGKTDILIKVNGKNIFIAECKFWNGKRDHTKTLNQILSYLSWRDTKAAVLVFNRKKDFSSVLKKIKASTDEHPKCKKMVKQNSETSWTYLFAHKDDSNRELTITVLAFDLPK